MMSRTERFFVVVLMVSVVTGALACVFCGRGVAAAPERCQSPLSPVPTPDWTDPGFCPYVFECPEGLCVWQVWTSAPIDMFEPEVREHLIDCWARQPGGDGLGGAIPGETEPRAAPCTFDPQSAYWEWLIFRRLSTCGR